MTRLFGRLNFVDAVIGLFVLALVPAAYFAFLLFRTPRPVITSVDPAQLTYIEERASAGTQLSGKLKVHGRGLQPLLRASIDNQPAVAFIFESPESADVLFGELPSGDHDLILFDGVQEVARAPRAVTIPVKTNAASARMRVAGTLVNLDEPAARALRVGQSFPANGRPEAELVALGDLRPDLRRVSEPSGAVHVAVEGRWQRPAAFVMSCDVGVPEECRVNGITLGSANRLLPVPGTAPPLALRIEEVVPAAAPRVGNARVRFVAHPETAELLKVGDVDSGAPVVDGRAASIATILSRQVAQGRTSVDVDLLLGVDPAQVGFQYRTKPIAAGTALTFTTARYVVKGTVLTLSVRSTESSKP